MHAADHNDPNPINSIFWNIDISPADLYDFFGFPADDTGRGERVAVALTFAPMPSTGVFDQDMLYRVRFDADPRIDRPTSDPESWSLDDLLDYARAVDDNFLDLEAAEVRVTFEAEGAAKLQFIGFAGGSFTEEIATNRITRLVSPDGHEIDAYVGGRDDAFFNDLPGFFRSINYGPQFYKIDFPAPMDQREMNIPKTLLELEGNVLFNFDPAQPRHGQGVKLDLPAGPYDFTPQSYKKDADGNFRFVYSGRDAQAGINVNAIILELPLAFLTDSPQTDRIVNSWGESWVLKAASKIEEIPDRARFNVRPWIVPVVLVALGVGLLALGLSGSTAGLGRLLAEPRAKTVTGLVLLAAGVAAVLVVRFLFGGPEADLDAELRRYKIVDTDGVPFEDAALSERFHANQLGANNLRLARDFARRTAHLGWGFGPSIDALGIKSSFDHDDSPLPVHRTYELATAAFPRVKKVLFQQLNMPDDSWNKSGKHIALKRGYEVFIPNVCAIDMDTTGTWPFGRRPEDQVATRFLSLFLDHSQRIGGQKVHVDTLGDQALWDSAPIEPKTPPNPLRNDKEFLDVFPYLADPW